MKTKFIKLTFQLFISSLLILSCENDEIIVETIENNNPKVKEATFKELSNDKNFIDAFSKIDKNNHLNNNSHARTIMENQYNFTIDDYPGKVIELDSLTSYTFSINNATRSDSIFENLVVNHYVNGTTKAAIFKYRPDISNPSYNSLINEHNSKSFVGTTEIIPINYNANEVQQRQTTICFTSVALLCSYGNAIHPAGKGCGSTFWGTQTNCETIFTSPDFYTSIVQIIEDTGDNNGGATSISVGMALADNFANTQLTPEQKIIYDLYPSIAEYLAKNVIVIPVPNYDPLLGGDPTMAVIDPEAEQFVLELIDGLINNTQPVYTIADYPGKNTGMPFEWWNDHNYMLTNFDILLEIPNGAELLAFSIFPDKALLHIQNSTTALNKAEQLVLSNTLTGIEDGRADAFRHAYWNALGTAEFGSVITQIFTDAHELNASGLPKQMDLHNNKKGREKAISMSFNFFSSDSVIADSILTEVYLGHLLFIFNGVLTPTY